MNILYITYVDMNNITSGSSVRPVRMYQAFLDEGHSVKLLSGQCGRNDEPARKKAVLEIMDWLENHRPDLCYIESPTYPIMFQCDYDLIRKLHKMHVSTGYFCRSFPLLGKIPPARLNRPEMTRIPTPPKKIPIHPNRDKTVACSKAVRSRVAVPECRSRRMTFGECC